MIRFTLAMLILTALVSCGQKKTPENSDPKIDQINQYVKNIVDSTTCYRCINTKVDTAKQVSIIYRHCKPVMLITSSAVKQKEQQYILSEEDDKVIYLHEVVTDPISQMRRENRFFYADSRLIKAETKSETGWVAYQTYDSICDYRLQTCLLNARVDSLIIDSENDRPRLTAAGNAARRQGAQYWVEGKQPYWSVMVSPNEKIVVVLNDGNEHYEYPVFEHSEQEGLLSYYRGTGEDGHSFELVLSSIIEQTEDTIGKVNALLTHRNSVYEGLAINLMDF